MEKRMRSFRVGIVGWLRAGSGGEGCVVWLYAFMPFWGEQRCVC